MTCERTKYFCQLHDLYYGESGLEVMGRSVPRYTHSYVLFIQGSSFSSNCSVAPDHFLKFSSIYEPVVESRGWYPDVDIHHHEDSPFIAY